MMFLDAAVPEELFGGGAALFAIPVTAVICFAVIGTFAAKFMRKKGENKDDKD